MKILIVQLDFFWCMYTVTALNINDIWYGKSENVPHPLFSKDLIFISSFLKEILLIV